MSIKLPCLLSAVRLALLATATLNLVPSASAQQLFTTPTNFVVGSAPSAVATGDFNGDGLRDLVVANQNSDTVSVLLNVTQPGAGAANFATQQTFAVATFPNSVAVGDINGDGLTDLIVANLGDNTVGVLLNSTTPGSPTLSFFAEQNFGTSLSPASVAVGDINSDGLLDVAVTDRGSTTVGVLFNMTSPGSNTVTFFPEQTFLADNSPTFVAVGDINGDGLLDLVAANQNSNTVSVSVNNGVPGDLVASFANPQLFVVGPTPVSVGLADVNGDGRLDLATTNHDDSTVSVLLNTTAPGATASSFAAQATFTVGQVPSALAWSDVNGDCIPDLLVSDPTVGRTSVLLNITTPGASTPSFALPQGFSAGNNVSAMAADDFNGDGKPDLAVASKADDQVGVLINVVPPITPTSNGLSFQIPQNFSTGTAPTLASGDFNGDGKTDLVSANQFANTVSVLLNTTATGGSTPTFAARQDFSTSAGPYAVAVGDVNTDGRLDLLVANQLSNTVGILLNTTAPGATIPSFATQVSIAVGTHPDSIAWGDLNGDGRPDMAVVNEHQNTVSVLLNTTTPNASTPSFTAHVAFAVGASPIWVAMGDINGDGRSDLAVSAITSNTVSVLLNTTAPGAPSPTFSTQQVYSVGTSPVPVALGDINGDGRPDIIVANQAASNVGVRLNTTAPGSTVSSFATQVTFTVAASPYSLSLADMNGDGLTDITAPSFDTATVSVLLNTTAPGAVTPSFAPHHDFAVVSLPWSAVVNDFNGDGKPDMAVANADVDLISVLLNLGGTSTTNLSSAPNSVYGQLVDYTATITNQLSNNPNTPTGTVQFQFDTVGTNLGSPVVVTGSGGVSTAVLTSSSVPAGTHLITGFYSGDGTFWANTVVPIIQTVTKASSATALASSANPAVSGASITFTATVTNVTPMSTGVATGTVDFFDGATNIGTGTLDSGGVATFSTASLSVGSHSVTAVYSGDLNFTGSTSAAVTQVVGVPAITPSGPTTFCAGGSVTLTSSSATGNQWFLNGNPIGGATNQTYVVTVSGNYTVQVGSGTVSAATTVTVNPIPATPTITPDGPTTFCEGGSVTLTSSSASGNQWYLNGNPIGGATNQTFVATASGGYTNVVTGSGCPSAASATTTVTVTPTPATPTITPGGPTTFCEGGSVTLTSSSASGNQWYLNGNPVGGATNQTFVATASGGYTNVVTGSGCPSAASATTTVTVTPTPATPTITPGGPTTFCEGGNVTLTSSSATGNQWYLNGNPIGGATNQVYVATASGNYTDVITSGGCSSSPSSATTVTVTPTPATPTITPGGPTTFCEGGNVTLTSSSATGNQWYLNGNPIGGATNQVYVATASGNYTDVITSGGCSSSPSSATTVTVTPTPATPTITPGGPTTFCEGGNVTLTSSSATGNQWYLNGNPIGGATNQVYVATASGNYTDVITSGGCSSSPSSATTVTVTPAPATPTITPGGPTTFCEGGNVTLTSSSATGNQWYLNGNPISGAINQVYVATSSGNYTDVITSGGCSSSPSSATTVTVTPTPATPTITPGGPTTFCEGGNVALTSSGASGNQWYLNGNSIAGATNQIYSATVAGDYTVTVTTSGCAGPPSAATTISADTAPTLTYGNQAAALSDSLTINPATGPTDNIAVSSIVVQSIGTYTGTISVNNSTGVVSVSNAAPAGTHTITIRATDSCGAITDASFTISVSNPALISLSSASYSVNETTGFITITVNRTGDLSVPVTVDYATDDSGSSNVCGTLNSGLASARCDFGLTLGTLRFAANETQQSFIIPISQDAFTEGAELFTVNLSNLSPGTVFATPSSAPVTINDSFAPAPNANDDTSAFVRQHYRDFLNREADPAGLAFWIDGIDNCTPKPECIALKRVNTSAAFFLSIEFQTTGNLVRNFYVAALNRPATNNMPEFVEFERDTQAMQRGLIVDPNDNGWQTVLANNQNAFMRDFVTRAEFVGMYPTTDKPNQYVDKLYLHAAISPTTTERDNAIAEFGGAPSADDAGARGRALLVVTQNAAFQQREINRSFVQMQYFGYLRRNPNDPPDNSFAGFDFWLAKLTAAGGNYIEADMVQAFLVSGEYRRRFGQ